MGGIRRILVGAMTQAKGKTTASTFTSLTKQDTANSVATGKEKQPLKDKAIGK